jgi:type I restriction enzyme M protein
VLFVDARKMGRKISRTQIEFSAAEVERIVSTYRAWRGAPGKKYVDESGFCTTVTLKEIEEHSFSLSPGRYVEAPESEEDEIEFEEKMAGLVDRLADELTASRQLEGDVRDALGTIGYEY